MHAAIDRANEVGHLWLSLAQLAWDSQSVVAMRMMGLSGTWTLSRDEHQDMIREKLPAYTEAMVAAGLAAVSGHSPDRVMHAALVPISDKARDNRQRLARNGPRLGPWSASPWKTAT